MENCKGFEYFTKSGEEKVNPKWEEGDCTPQDLDSTKECDYKFHQLNFFKKNACESGGNGSEVAGLIGFHRKGEDQSGKIRQWWNKIEKDQFNGMSSRKEYNQVAKDIIEGNKDASPRLIATAVLERELEHQAKQYSLYKTGVRQDAKEVADAISGVFTDQD